MIKSLASASQVFFVYLTSLVICPARAVQLAASVSKWGFPQHWLACTLVTVRQGLQGTQAVQAQIFRILSDIQWQQAVQAQIARILSNMQWQQAVQGQIVRMLSDLQWQQAIQGQIVRILSNIQWHLKFQRTTGTNCENVISYSRGHKMNRRMNQNTSWCSRGHS